ncbi:MAG: hypothetical protein O9340_06730 [Cyclobacteriaceae bacterium]|nr:hypothetical protein [Cyclobacteriaceae bacterium]
MKEVSRICIPLFFILLFACDSGDDKPFGLEDKQFFPLQKGYFLQFQVQSTVYTAGPVGTVNQFQKKWLVIERFINDENEESFILHELTRVNESADWSYQKTLQATINSFGLIIEEDNKGFQKLKFPVVKGNEWNVNEFNIEPEKNIKIIDLLDTKEVENFTYPNVAEVEYSNEVDRIIGNDIQREWFAYQVGLIETYTEKITYCTNTPACLGQQIIQSGIIESTKLIAYGVEE